MGRGGGGSDGKEGVINQKTNPFINLEKTGKIAAVSKYHRCIHGL